MFGRITTIIQFYFNMPSPSELFMYHIYLVEYHGYCLKYICSCDERACVDLLLTAQYQGF